MIERHTQHMLAGISRQHIIRPYFINGNVTVNINLNLLCDSIVSELYIYFSMKIDGQCQTAMYCFNKTAFRHLLGKV